MPTTARSEITSVFFARIISDRPPRLTLRPARDRGLWLPARCVRPPLSFVGPQWVCPYRYGPSFLPAIGARWVPGRGRDGRDAAISGNRGEPSDSVGCGQHFE